MPTFGSLFAGIGGLDLGLERAGWTCKWQVEIDDYATRVLEKHWPTVRRWRDVSQFIDDTQSLRREDGFAQDKGSATRQEHTSSDTTSLRVDVICGGFPCQPVSVAGRRAGDADERWLWPAFRQVVELIRPRWVLAENVPGLLSAGSGRLFGGILRDLAGLGYDAEWGVLPAAAFGALHLRKRVFIVGYTDGQRQQGHWANGQSKPEATRSPPELEGGIWRAIEPTVCRGNHGVSARVDRLKCLGNAVVPQVAEWLGRQILTRSTADLTGGE